MIQTLEGDDGVLFSEWLDVSDLGLSTFAGVSGLASSVGATFSWDSFDSVACALFSGTASSGVFGRFRSRAAILSSASFNFASRSKERPSATWALSSEALKKIAQVFGN